MELYLISRLLCFGIIAVLIVAALVFMQKQKHAISALCFALAVVLPLMLLSFQPRVRPILLIPAETVPQETQAPALPMPEIGHFIPFGTYPHAPDAEPTPISWRVLDQKDDQILVMSFYPLERRRYREDNGDCTWETSDIRPWLNGEFLETAFSPEEQERIVPTTLHTESNPEYGIPSGMDTTDRVFLLSYEEVDRLLPTEEERRCKPTDYAKEQSAFVNENGNTWWILRTVGENAHSVTYVNSDGSLNPEGCIVCSDGGTIRPAMWITWNQEQP